MGLLSESVIQSALDLQARSYRLLEWLESAMDRGFVAPETALEHGRGKDGAHQWLDRHFLNLPQDVRGERDELWRLAGYFTTYFEGTFELETTPGKRLYSVDAHCFCPACSYMIQKPHLRPRRVTATDKKHAHRLMERQLRSICEETLRIVEDSQIAALLGDRHAVEDVALLTYIVNVEERAHGRIRGATPLALWRLFAWTETGSPRKGLKLNPEVVLAAQDRVLLRLPPPISYTD